MSASCRSEVATTMPTGEGSANEARTATPARACWDVGLLGVDQSLRVRYRPDFHAFARDRLARRGGRQARFAGMAPVSRTARRSVDRRASPSGRSLKGSAITRALCLMTPETARPVDSLCPDGLVGFEEAPRVLDDFVDVLR